MHRKISRPCDTNSGDDVNSFRLASPIYIAFAYVSFILFYLVLAASFRAHSCVTSVNRTRRRGMRSFFLFFFFTLNPSYSLFVLSRLISIFYISTANALNVILLSFPDFSRCTLLFTILHFYPIRYSIILLPFSPLEKISNAKFLFVSESCEFPFFSRHQNHNYDRFFFFFYIFLCR